MLYTLPEAFILGIIVLIRLALAFTVLAIALLVIHFIILAITKGQVKLIGLLWNLTGRLLDME